ncbi:hypothetical protein BEL04_08355 [Mucilaginibacter sp. PPCGB 2223]|uniref:hypothetical protein n=1 Tax=Mucilaginibacter sp. PPCGB 2223 TaxID=1886027 RepID=UPI000825500F|nr:hypothetical protein [Mucilaginibacter sp. PPCGB 2223]OCX54259.1 hypothetical protein BEL04_08355 [Mucilaginibacter sp. PPCGB 2223]
MNKKIKRIAVVVVHGMGEQRPMDTLRSFVAGVKWQLETLDADEKNVKVRSKPDSIGDIFETSRLSMEGCYDSADHKTQKRPITDFYEFYWAHNMRGTRFGQMQTWLTQVILKPVSKVPPRLKKIWWTVWGLFILFAVISFLFAHHFFHLPSAWKAVAALFGGTTLSLIGGAVSSFFKTSFLNSLGDVARYMTPEPDNIGERSHIRQQGIAFLKKMHAISNITKPDRIIVVAHSLGTVVSYDLLRLLWTQHNTVCSTAPDHGQPAMDKLNELSTQDTSFDLTAFQAAQYRCWAESQDLGNTWLVTDFITLGAALNAMDYFMVTNEAVPKLIEERELPVCPPVPDEKTNTVYYRELLDQGDGLKRKGANVLHHGALFGMTRWTNIFYTSDFVGGPMQRIFGKGIVDIPVPRKSFWAYPGGHTEYWDKADGHNQALRELTQALKLNNRDEPAVQASA